MTASTKHPLTDNERTAIRALLGTTFPVASWDKRFARDVLFPALETGMLGEKAVPQLWRIFIRYRRQHAGITAKEQSDLLVMAARWSARDFRKEAAKNRAAEEEKQKYEKAMSNK